MTLRILRITFLALVTLCGCPRKPDFDAFCRKAAPCEGKSVAACVETSATLYDEQKQRGCADEGAATIACEIEHGQCESAGGWTLFMPTNACLPQIEKLGDCLGRKKP
jgi:hypothetical protein